MRSFHGLHLAAALLAAALLAAPPLRGAADTLQSRNEAMLTELAAVHHLTPEQLAAVRAVLAGAPFLGQGNPAIARHPITEEGCRERLAESGTSYADPSFERICGSPFMAPLYDPESEAPEDARACIDQFEFPDIPCTYPVVWVKAREAAQLCAAVGKRLCDAHEWEGACQGRLTPPDYRFDLAAGADPSTQVKVRRDAHNRAHAADKRWSYGPEYRAGVCAAASSKTPGCEGGGWNACGSNTYPTGAFPECHSSLGVYDVNGNAAEHMNLPLAPDQMASTGSETLGVTEMKGSWFIFDSYRAHEDWCRWRAPYWHGSRVMDPHSHQNYHLGFRCCKTLDAEASEPGEAGEAGTADEVSEPSSPSSSSTQPRP